MRWGKIGWTEGPLEGVKTLSRPSVPLSGQSSGAQVASCGHRAVLREGFEKGCERLAGLRTTDAAPSAWRRSRPLDGKAGGTFSNCRHTDGVGSKWWHLEAPGRGFDPSHASAWPRP